MSLSRQLWPLGVLQSLHFTASALLISHTKRSMFCRTGVARAPRRGQRAVARNSTVYALYVPLFVACTFLIVVASRLCGYLHVSRLCGRCFLPLLRQVRPEELKDMDTMRKRCPLEVSYYSSTLLQDSNTLLPCTLHVVGR